MNRKSCRVLIAGCLMAAGAMTVAQVTPQGAPVYADPSQGGSPPGYSGMVAPPATPAPASHPIRKLFAGTIMAVLQGVGGALVGSLEQGVNGSIQNWFARNQGTSAAYGQQGVPAYAPSGTTYPAPASATYPAGTSGVTYPATSGYPTTNAPAPMAYPGTAYPGTTGAPPAGVQYPGSAPTYVPASPAVATATQPANPGGYPNPPVSGTAPAAYSGAPMTYPATGAMYSTAPATAPVVNAPAAPPTLVAGIAYEVHAQLPGQPDQLVDENTYQFRTGDRFTVYLRPSTPGRLEVYNINPLGQQNLIDSTTLAAGQLSVLGPYAFTANSGDEQLNLIISPCANPQLLATSRDIVNLAGAPTGTAVSLPGCSATRGLDVHTRDIQKVAVEAGTTFAVDNIAPSELAAGQITPRSVILHFHHL